MASIDSLEDKKKNEVAINFDDLPDFDTKDAFLSQIFSSSIDFSRADMTWQEKIKHVMESNLFHIVVIVLILLDTACVAGELIIEAEKEKSEYVEHLEKFLKYFGLSILSVFMIELVFKILFNRHEFLHSKLEMFDAFVIVVSFTLDLVFIKDELLAALGFITILRLWRMTRIVNGIVVTVKNRANARIEKYKEGLKHLQEENVKLKGQLEKQETLLADIKTVYLF